MEEIETREKNDPHRRHLLYTSALTFAAFQFGRIGTAVAQSDRAPPASGVLAVNRASARSAAPELVGIDGWLNTDRPLTMAGLRGQAVLVEFGTYTCINWRRTLPYVNRWHSEYGPQGLHIITVHTPEFGFERTRAYFETAIRELNVHNPI